MTRSAVVSLSAALLVGLLGLGAPAAHAQNAAGNDPTAQWPAWLREAMAAESARLRASKIAFGDGALESRLAGRAVAAPQAIGKNWYVATDIGTPAPLECWVFNDDVDLAATTANIAEAGIEAAVQANGALQERALFLVDAGAYDSAPYLALEWMYSVGEPPNALAGLAKVRAAQLNDITLVCSHNYLGYRDTFATAFEEFVRRASIFGESNGAYYEEIAIQRIGDQALAVTRSHFALDADGDTQITTTEASLLPIDAVTLTISDSRQIAYSRPDGSLISEHVAVSENGELTMQLSLTAAEPEQWTVAGRMQGKEIEHRFGAGVEPLSELGQMRAVRALLADPDRDRLTLPTWIPAADPTQFVDAEVILSPDGRDQGHASLAMGPLSVTARFDDAGSMVDGRIQSGPAEVVIERVWARGSL